LFSEGKAIVDRFCGIKINYYIALGVVGVKGGLVV